MARIFHGGGSNRATAISTGNGRIRRGRRGGGLVQSVEFVVGVRQGQWQPICRRWDWGGGVSASVP